MFQNISNYVITTLLAVLRVVLILMEVETCSFGSDKLLSYSEEVHISPHGLWSGLYPMVWQ